MKTLCIKLYQYISKILDNFSELHKINMRDMLDNIKHESIMRRGFIYTHTFNAFINSQNVGEFCTKIEDVIVNENSIYNDRPLTKIQRLLRIIYNHFADDIEKNEIGCILYDMCKENYKIIY